MRSFEKKYTEYYDYKTKREVTSLLNTVTSFEFIISLIGFYRLFHPLAGINNRLQGVVLISLKLMTYQVC